jgi:cation:H+ antiporter
MEILIQLGLLIIGFVLLMKGADWFVDGAAGIAGKFGIPQLVIGLTIVAMGTSAPEAAVSIASALKGSAAITIGNVLGSNIMNILVILGISAVLIPVAVAESTVKVEMPFMIAMTVLLLVLGMTDHKIVFFEGVILWVCFIGFMIYLFMMARQSDGEEEAEANKDKPIWLLILLTIIGVIMIIKGSDVAVDAATAISRILGMSERFIALTVVALGTSLPELFTSVTAAKKGNADIAIGNIVGSNIFNILFVVGTSALITPVIFESKFIVDSIVAILAGVLLWVCTFKKKLLVRPHGVIMLVCYGVYFVYLLMLAEKVAPVIEELVG